MFKFLKTNKSELLLLFSGLFLIGYALFIYFNATDLTYAAGPSKTEVRLYVLIRIITGLLYTIAIFFLVKSVTFKSHHLIIMFAIGIIGRIILLPTEPILEDDYNRYLWDGAVTAHGINPYKYPPEWFIEQDTVKEGIDPIIYRLAESSGDIIKNINHPHIRTIYPPVAQIVFAISYFANPWSTTYYKLLLLVADLIIFILLLVLLKKMILPTSLVAIYWLNPILLHEIFNSGHMDILVFPFILAGILYLFSDKFVKSVVYFSIAVGVKIWPVIFIPFVLKRTSNNKRILITSIISSLVIIVIILSPVLLTKIDDSLGFVSYSKNWSNNELLFQILNLLTKEIINLFNFSYTCSHCITRWIVILIFLSLLIYLLKGTPNNNIEMMLTFYLLIATMYLISPTQFPWYYTWILPVLIFNPRLSFIIYAVFLPLYQLSYSHDYIVWIEHLPVIVLFICELKFKKLGALLMPDRNIEIRINS